MIRNLIRKPWFWVCSVAAILLVIYLALTYTPRPNIENLSELTEETCTLGDMEYYLIQELNRASLIPYRVGTPRFISAVREAMMSGLPKPSGNLPGDWYRLYMLTYIHAHELNMIGASNFGFWKKLRPITIAEILNGNVEDTVRQLYSE